MRVLDDKPDSACFPPNEKWLMDECARINVKQVLLLIGPTRDLFIFVVCYSNSNKGNTTPSALRSGFPTLKQLCTWRTGSNCADMILVLFWLYCNRHRLLKVIRRLLAFFVYQRRVPATSSQLYTAVLKQIACQSRKPCSDAIVTYDLDRNLLSEIHTNACGVLTCDSSPVVFVCTKKYVWLLSFRIRSLNAFLGQAWAAANHRPKNQASYATI